jgi:ATP-dependent HslUV protease ATP-binding subunit HslU
MGIIFIDEIDKIASKENRVGADVSREGVQRDILPIVEGSTVTTKYGMVDTSHILFIAAARSIPASLGPHPRAPGAVSHPGRTRRSGAEDFRKILTQPEKRPDQAVRGAPADRGGHPGFHRRGVTRLSELAAEVNARTENIGARRLHTIMELLWRRFLISPRPEGQTIALPRLREREDEGVIEDHDLSRYIL